MIISDKYKYLFIETPHTGSTAISKELVENYDGKKILHKHANYHEFLKTAKPEQKEYFVFAGVRNPLDEAYSLYNKFLTNHKSNYTDPSKLLENGGWVTKRKVEIYKLVQSEKDFGKFVGRNYKSTYTSNIDINKKYCDYILRFENLDKDFSETLRLTGIKQKRKLPKINKTSKKGRFDDNFDKNVREYCAKKFGPFMNRWGYEFPESWGKNQINFIDSALYRINIVGRNIYSRYIKSGPLSKNIKKIRNLFE